MALVQKELDMENPCLIPPGKTRKEVIGSNCDAFYSRQIN